MLLILVSTAMIGAAYLGMAASQTLVLACLASIVGGAGNGIQWISVVTAIQEATPAQYQMRVVGFLESLGAAMPGVGFLLGGALVALGSPRTAFLFAGIGVLALAFAGLLLRSKIDVGVRGPSFVADTAPPATPDPLARDAHARAEPRHPLRGTAARPRPRIWRASRS